MFWFKKKISRAKLLALILAQQMMVNDEKPGKIDKSVEVEYNNIQH